MTKEKIMNDIKFKQRCGAYGLNYENCEIYDDVILLNTPTFGLYVLFDKNYNTIGVEYFDFYRYKSKEEFVKDKYYEYCNFTDTLPFGSTFDYPFDNFTLKHIIDLSNCVEVIENNYGQILVTRINDKSYYRGKNKNDDYFQLLSYVKFLGEEIKQYFYLIIIWKVLDVKILQIFMIM